MADEILVLKLQLNADASIKTIDDLIQRNKDLVKLLKQAPLEGQEGFDKLTDSIEKAKKEYALNRQEINKFNASLTDTKVASDSIDGLTQLLKKLEAEYKILSKAERDADGGDLKDKIQAIKQEISLLNSELKVTEKEVEKIKEPDISTTSIVGLTNKIKDLEAEYKLLSEEQRNTLGPKLKEQINSATDELTKLNRGLKETTIAGDSYKGLSRSLRDLEENYKLLSKEERALFGQEIRDKILATRNELKDLEADLGDYRRNVGNYPKILQGDFFGLGDTIRDLSVAAAAVFTFDLAKDAVKQIAAITKEFQNLNSEIKNLTGATGSELDSFTIQVAAIGKTFSQDTSEITLAANALSKGMGISFGESLKLIENGFLSGANANGEFLESIKEYPALIAETGATADQFIAIISQSAKGGIFSDKGADTIKEAGLRLREQTKATQDAIIGLFGVTEGKALLGELNTGETSIIDAIQKISGKLAELPPQSAVVGTAIADIFGGPGEDAGLAFLTSLKDIDVESSALIDTTDSLTRSQIAQLAVEKQLAQAQNEMSKNFTSLVDGATNFGLRVQTFLINVLNAIVTALAPVGVALSAVGNKLYSFAEQIGLVSNQSSILNDVINLISRGFSILGFVISQGINLVGFFIDGIVALYNNFLPLRIAVQATIGIFNLFRSALANLPATFNGIIAGIKQLGTNMVAFFSDVLLNARIFAKQIEGVFTIRESAIARLNDEINALRAQRGQIAAAGRSIGEAFTEEFQRTVAEMDAVNAMANIEIVDPAADLGVKAGTNFQTAFNQQIDGTETAAKLAKTIPAALEKVLQEGSVDALRAKVNELNTLLGNMVPGSDLFLETAEKIKLATEKLNAAEEARKQAILTDDELLKQKQENAKKLEDELLASAAKALENRRADIDLQLAENKRASQLIRDEKLASENLTADERKKINDDYNSAVLEGELQAEKERLALLQEGSTEKINLEIEIAEKELAIRQKFYDDDVAKSAAAEEKKQANKQMFIDMAIGAAQTLSDTFFTIAKNNLDRETDAQLEKLDTETEAKIAAAAGNEEEQIRIKANAEEQKRAIEKKAAEERKKQAVIQAIINGALAAINTLANTTIPYPAAFALLIPTAVAVAAEIAVIESSTFKKGKAPEKASRGKIARGRLHSQGGIPATIGGVEPVEIETDEAIINRYSSMKHMQVLSDINQEQGGIRFPGTEKLTTERRERLNLYNSVSSQYPILAARGLAPRIPNLVAKKRRLADGAVAAIENVKIPDSGLSPGDVERIAKAAEAGTKAGIQGANLYENFKRQLEREQELNERAAV